VKHDFRFYFNKRRQWVNVFLHKVTPRTFEKHGGGRWGYFLATWEEPDRGEFGELHFVKRRLRFDLVYHEIRHLCIEHFRANKKRITVQNEEESVSFEDKIAHAFRRGLKRKEPGIKL
jgi:hypothetical protein